LIRGAEAALCQVHSEFAEKESGVKAEIIVKTGARDRDRREPVPLRHLWARAVRRANLGGWQSARALMLLHVADRIRRNSGADTI